MDAAQRFEAMVLETEGALRAFIAGMGVGRHAVDDIAQEAYLAVWAQGVPDGIEPVRWLKGIARKKAVDHLRAASPRRRAVAELAAAASLPEVDDAEPNHPELGALRQCLQRLEPQDADLLRRHYHDDQSSDAIAQAAGLTGSAVRKQLIRLREGLERCIARRLGGLQGDGA